MTALFASVASVASPLDDARVRMTAIPVWVGVVLILLIVLVAIAVLAGFIIRQRRKAAQAAAGTPDQPDPTPLIRATFGLVEQRLREKVPSKPLRDAIPRILVLGEPGSGKTTALAATLLNTPLDKANDPKPGDGAPVHLWSFDKALIVDPAGSLLLTPDGESPEPPAGLDAVLSAMKRGHGARPVDAIVLMIPCTDLVPSAHATDDDRKRKATTLHKELGDIQRKLGMRVPVYVLVTKCDALPSFQSFGRETAALSRSGILGWSRKDDHGTARPGSGLPVEDYVGEAMEELKDRLAGRQIARFLQKPATNAAAGHVDRLGAADGLFLFPGELTSIADKLRIYVDEIFVPSVYDEPFLLRGIYFCGDGGGTVIAAPTAAGVVAASSAKNPATNPATSGVRGVLFVRELFDKKIIPEANLARPSAGAQRTRGALILALQIVAGLMGLGAGIGLTLESQRLTNDSAMLEPVLTHIQRDVGLLASTNEAAAPPSADEQREQTLSLLADFAAVRMDQLASPFIPLSELSLTRGGLDGRVLEATELGYKRVILETFHTWLDRRGRELVIEEGPLPHGSEAALNVETTPEFVHVDRWLEQVATYDRAVQQYRRLGSRATRNGRDLTPTDEQIESEARLQAVADLADYLLSHRVEPGFFTDSHYYRAAMTRGIGAGEFQVDVGPTLEARNKAHVLFARLFDVLELHKDRDAREGLRQIESGFEYLASNTSAYEKTFSLRDLQDLYSAIQTTDRALRAPLLSWVPSGMAPESQGVSRVLSKVETSPLLGEAEASTLRGDASERLRVFQLTLKSASAPIAGYLLKRQKDGELDMLLSEELTGFKSALDDLLAERFMAAGTADRLPAFRERFTWDVELLKDCASLVKDYDAFEQSAQFKRFRGANPEQTQALQRTIMSLARNQLRVGLINRIARSIVREPTLRGAPLADQTRADVENLRLATAPLRQILGTFVRFHFDDDRDDLRGIVRSQGARLLIDAYGVLNGKRLYEVKGGNFAWWHTGPTPAFDAFGVTDLAGLTEFVNGERTQASDTSKELAEPVLALLESGEVGALLNPVEGMGEWRGVIVPLHDYEVKKPGNGVSALEHFILVELPKITLENCLSFAPSLGRSNDFFTAKARSIHRRLQERCADLSGEMIQAKYFELWRTFNSQLAGRFPFAKLEPGVHVEDAPPEAVRDFLDKDSIEDKFYKAYHIEIGRRAASGDENWRQVLRFLSQLETVKAFLVPMWAQSESARDGSFDIDLDFRANPAHEIRGSQIAEWLFDVPEKRVSYGDPKEKLRAHWRMDDSVRLTLRWAKNSPDQPTIQQDDAKTSQGMVRDNRVSFEANDFWALLRLIATYQTNIRDADVAYDPTSNFLTFKVQTRPDPNGGFVDRVGIDSGIAQVFLRLVLYGGDKKRLQKYPDFPVLAPPPPSSTEYVAPFELPRATRRKITPRRRTAPSRKPLMPTDLGPKDIEALLAPVSADKPEGESLRYTGVYEKVREARRADDPSLPQGEWATELKRADFGAVVALCADALAHKSKDLQVAVWLVEAWTELEGLSGLTTGLHLLTDLVGRYWDSMYPSLEDGLEERTALFDWIDDSLRLRLRQMSIVGAAAASPFSALDWEVARDRGTREAEEGAPTWEAILSRTTQSGRVHWQTLYTTLDGAVRARAELDQMIESKSGAIALRRTAEALKSISNIVDYALRSLGAAPPVAAAHAEPASTALGATRASAGSAGDGSGPGASLGGAIQSRSEAYLRLTEAADFLLRTEPHSPVPYLVMRAVSWGTMPLGQLLQEFVGQADDLVAIQVLLGMRRRDGE